MDDCVMLVLGLPKSLRLRKRLGASLEGANNPPSGYAWVTYTDPQTGQQRLVTYTDPSTGALRPVMASLN